MAHALRAVGYPPATPTPGPYFSAPETNTVWSANGETMVATCLSAHLSREGNIANARYLAKCSELPTIVRRAEAVLRGNGVQPRQISASLTEQLLYDLQRVMADLGETA